jgi:hypothetical protein
MNSKLDTLKLVLNAITAIAAAFGLYYLHNENSILQERLDIDTRAYGSIVLRNDSSSTVMIDWQDGDKNRFKIQVMAGFLNTGNVPLNYIGSIAYLSKDQFNLLDRICEDKYVNKGDLIYGNYCRGLRGTEIINGMIINEKLGVYSVEFNDRYTFTMLFFYTDRHKKYYATESQIVLDLRREYLGDTLRPKAEYKEFAFYHEVNSKRIDSICNRISTPMKNTVADTLVARMKN